MKLNTYQLIRKIHLYASLSIVLLLLMYIVTSYMMIYHHWFSDGRNTEKVSVINLDPSLLSDSGWEEFRNTHAIKGRMIRENFMESGDQIREYAGAGNTYRITVFKDKKVVEIKQTIKNLADTIIGFHRLRGYGGPAQYNLYAFMLDVVGICLILFALTGIILWLRLLKYNVIAWIILISGFVYTGVVIGYLLLV